MTKVNFLTADKIRFMAGTALLAVLTGCVAEPSNPRTAYQGRPQIYGRNMLAYQDDYDYYPGYEVYYGRSRREFVYRDGNSWVRGSAPRGVTAAMVLASPSVRMEFRDSPEQHHSTVVQSYPRNWAPPGRSRDLQAAPERSRAIYPERPATLPRATVAAASAYDYYPGYEVYYSRDRREYVYRDGSAWVQRPAPRGVTVAVLTASPSVALELQGPPEQNHGTVVRSYPKNWKNGDKKHDEKDERHKDKNDDKRDNDRRN